MIKTITIILMCVLTFYYPLAAGIPSAFILAAMIIWHNLTKDLP